MTGSDEQLIARLRAVAGAADAPPAMVAEAARAAYGLRALDAELAELVADSVESAGLVRGPATIRLLSFEAGELAVEIEVTQSGDLRRLVGQVEGAAGVVLVDTPAGTSSADLDESGRFDVAGVPPGPVRLRCTTSDGRAVATSWTAV